MKKLGACQEMAVSWRVIVAKNLFSFYPRIYKAGVVRRKAARILSCIPKIIQAKYIRKVLRKIRDTTTIQKHIRRYLAQKRYSILLLRNTKALIIQKFFRTLKEKRILKARQLFKRKQIISL